MYFIENDLKTNDSSWCCVNEAKKKGKKEGKNFDTKSLILLFLHAPMIIIQTTEKNENFYPLSSKITNLIFPLLFTDSY